MIILSGMIFPASIIINNFRCNCQNRICGHQTSQCGIVQEKKINLKMKNDTILRVSAAGEVSGQISSLVDTECEMR